MKIHSLLIAALALLTSCDRAEKPAHEHEAAAAFFKEGHGVRLSEAMQRSLQIRLSEVQEQTLAPRERIPLHVFRSSGTTSEAGGWTSAANAKSLPAGGTIALELADGGRSEGYVTRVTKSPTPALDDREVVVRIAAALPLGSSLHALVDLPEARDAVTVPAASIIKGADGEFVYVANEEYFARTPVRTGARSEQTVEVTDGLYTGDEVVVSGATSLWMTELQSLRAGQACTHGH